MKKEDTTKKIQPSPKELEPLDTMQVVLTCIANGENILLHAPGGTGKTHFLRELAKILVDKGKIVAMTSTTGISAINLAVPEKSLLPRTLHSWAGAELGHGSADSLYGKINDKEKVKRRWLTTDVLIVDEISMMGATFFDKLNYVGKHIRRRQKLAFGGLQLVVSGDFLQLPPVKDGWVFESIAWPELDFRCVMFSEPKRYDDLAYFEMLLRVREGEQTQDDIDRLSKCVQKYDKWKDKTANSPDTVRPTILFSKKVDTDVYNERELAKLSTPFKEYVAKDIFTKYKGSASESYYVPMLEDSIPRVIRLKVGAQVMLKRNFDLDAGLVNGSRGVVLGMTDEEVVVKFVKGQIYHIPLMLWKFEDKDAKAVRVQVPFIVAYALTIHKCQGCTLDSAVCDLGPSIFSAGQAYVALSRVRNWEGLYLSEFIPKSIKVDEKALKYVKVLKDA